MESQQRRKNRLVAYAYLIEKHPWGFLIANVIAILTLYYFLCPELVFKLLLKGILTFILSSIIAIAIKVTVKRARWEVKSIQDYRMPSYHQTIATAMCVLAMIYMPILIPWFVALIILTAWGRYVIEKHTIDEIVIGAIVGTIVAIAIGFLNTC